MSELITTTAKLLPRSKRLKPFPGFATAYYYEAEDQVSELGSLYVAIEVLTNPKQAETVADLVIETLGNHFYNLSDDQNTPLERFEQAVKATNQALAEYTNKGNASWVGRMSAVIAVIVSDEIHISQTGSAEAYLYRGNITSHVTADLHNKSQQRPINTFANIATGQLQLHDRLVIATPAFFHQVLRTQLKSILKDNTASSGIQKLSELINDSDEASRVALIIVELTTAELLAQQVQSDQPESIAVGQPDKPLEIAKAIASPAARSILNSSKSLSTKAAEQAKNHVVPKMNNLGHQAAGAIRSRLHTKGGQLQLIGVVLTIIIIIISLGARRSLNQTQSQKIAIFHSIYQDYAKAQTMAASGDKDGASKVLSRANSQLSSLKGTVNEAAFSSTLSSRSHLEAEPTSISALESQITTLLDKLNNVAKLKSTVLADLTKLKNTKPTFLELVGTKLIMADGQGNSSFYVYDLTAKTVSTSPKTPTGFGRVVATTPSSDNSGIYVLTDKPSVWFYKAIDGTISEQSLSFGDWPRGKALASYNGNLYVLAHDSSQLYKFSPTSAGFTAPVDYFTDASTIKDTTTIAIDGSIYLMGGKSGIRRFVAGVLDESLAPLPQNFINPTHLRSIGNGDRLIAIDSKSLQLVLFESTPDALIMGDQVTLDSTPVYSVTVDSSSTTLYALTRGKLISAPLP